MLMSAPDVSSCGRQTVTVSHRKTTADTTIVTIADLRSFLVLVSLQADCFLHRRLSPVSLRLLKAAREQRQMSVPKLSSEGRMRDERC